jgi:hypothetical protein
LPTMHRSHPRDSVISSQNRSLVPCHPRNTCGFELSTHVSPLNPPRSGSHTPLHKARERTCRSDDRPLAASRDAPEPDIP